jgi:hypothetical protein
MAPTPHHWRSTTLDALNVVTNEAPPTGWVTDGGTWLILLVLAAIGGGFGASFPIVGASLPAGWSKRGGQRRLGCHEAWPAFAVKAWAGC